MGAGLRPGSVQTGVGVKVGGDGFESWRTVNGGAALVCQPGRREAQRARPDPGPQAGGRQEAVGVLSPGPEPRK